jgi:predicted dinucleotide-binding enzyme
MKKIAIIGKGNVGSALERGLTRSGHEVRATGRDSVRETAAWGDVIILAVPFRAIDDAVKTIGDAADGKILIDVTNALDENMGLAIGCTTSGAEELQTKAPAANVVKAFNTVFARHMDKGRVGDRPLTVFTAGNDDAARKSVRDLAIGIGFEAVDSGPLQNARWLETLGYLNIQLGYIVGHGTDTGFHYIH